MKECVASVSRRGNKELVNECVRVEERVAGRICE